MHYNASWSKLSKKLKKGIEILADQAVFKLWIKTVKILFWSITQELLDLLKYYFNAIFEFLGQSYIRCMYHFQKGVDNFEIQHKAC